MCGFVRKFLRFGNAVSPSQYADPVDQQLWANIIKDWPILNGADTLLGFQAMLRLFMYLAIVLRTYSKWGKPAQSDGEEESPISGMSAMLALAGMIARVTLITSTTNYELDGPLGASLPVACEMAMVPLMTTLAFKTGKKMSAVAVSAAVGIATWWASHHYLNESGDLKKHIYKGCSAWADRQAPQTYSYVFQEHEYHVSKLACIENNCNEKYYQPEEVISCHSCTATYDTSYKGKLCHTCQLCEIGANTLGIQLRPI